MCCTRLEEISASNGYVVVIVVETWTKTYGYELSDMKIEMRQICRNVICIDCGIYINYPMDYSPALQRNPVTFVFRTFLAVNTILDAAIFQYANVAGWTAAMATALGVLYGLYGLSNGDIFSPVADAIYRGLHRTVWALAVSWVIFACVTGNGGERKCACEKHTNLHER